MTPRQKIELRQSENRSEVRSILGKDDKTTEDHDRLKELTRAAEDLEVELRAAIAVEPEPESVTTTATDGADVELRALKDRCSVGRFLLAGMGRRKLEGAELEYRQEVGAEPGTLPYDLLEDDDEAAVETRADTVSGPPSTTGRRWTSIVPAAFSASAAGMLGVQMPRVGSGQFAQPRLTTSLTASMRAAGSPQESTAAAFTVDTTSPHRCSARLSLREEDLRSVGIASFESSLRQNLRMVMSDVVDKQILRGSGATNNVTGLISRLTAPANDTATVTFSSWAQKCAGLISGRFAPRLNALRILTNDAAMTALAATFATSDDSVTALDWSARHGISVSTSAQMAGNASGGHSTALVFRAGGGVNPSNAASMPAVCPVWGDLAIDDMYTSAASAERHVTLHAFIGDVILKYPVADGPYSLIKLKTS